MPKKVSQRRRNESKGDVILRQMTEYYSWVIPKTLRDKCAEILGMTEKVSPMEAHLPAKPVRLHINIEGKISTDAQSCA